MNFEMFGTFMIGVTVGFVLGALWHGLMKSGDKYDRDVQINTRHDEHEDHYL